MPSANSILDAYTYQNKLKIYYNQKRYVEDALNQSEIANWYNTAAQSNIGKFSQVQELINAGNYQSAYNLNQTINATLLPEINQKNYNSIFLNHYLRMQKMPAHH